ncbi:LysR family transcriptional regulator [Anaerolentibacter hominis]|uniref:LysR family transcriptional regulator n=1 Tax=Anaerolentibacter hominis TaxID=3079009 RepID=UPI0031B83553
MNLVHLKYIIEVEKTGSISKAAANLFMGQPNLSKAIKELEEEIGITIFNRTAKGVETTDQGAEFLSYAKTILRQVDEMEAFYKNPKTDKQAFSISIPRASYITYAFTRFVNSLDHTKPMSINYKETNSIEAINNILEHKYNLAIIRYPNVYEPYFLSLLHDKDMKYEVIWEVEYVLIMSRKHPLAFTREISYEDLKPYVEVVHGDMAVPHLSPTYVKKAEEEESASQRKIYVYERGSQFDFLTNVTDTYMWVSPLPQEILDRHDLVERQCKDVIKKNKDVLVQPSNYKLTDLDKSFIKLLKQTRDETGRKWV